MGVAVPSLAILAETQNLEAQLLPGPFFFLSLFFLVAFVFFCLLFLLSSFSFCRGATGQAARGSLKSAAMEGSAPSPKKTAASSNAAASVHVDNDTSRTQILGMAPESHDKHMSNTVLV